MTTATQIKPSTLKAETIVKICTENGVSAKVVAAGCHRCGGTGTYFGHGVCFRCGGTGKDPSAKSYRILTPATEAQAQAVNAEIARREGVNAKATATRQAKKASKRDAFINGNPALKSYVEIRSARDAGDKHAAAILNDLPAFAHDIAQKCLNFDRMSEAQHKALEKCLNLTEDRIVERNAKRDAENAAAADAPAGRVEVTGEVLSIKTYDGDFGTTYKMLVKSTEGFKVFTSIPAAIRDDVQKGTIVTFTATLAPSHDDPKFAKGSRPSKASIG